MGTAPPCSVGPAMGTALPICVEHGQGSLSCERDGNVEGVDGKVHDSEGTDVWGQLHRVLWDPLWEQLFRSVLSTDKAVYPVNAMGMSKGLMEKCMIAKARMYGDSSTVFCGTRYGNSSSDLC